jgi:N,N-dimethylformamidase beta subunit-like, C-terminal/Putative Ig domain/Secretion system C-terminal sorting domain
MKFFNVVRFAILFIISVLYFPLLFAQQGGYADNITVVQGDTLNFYISTSYNPITISIFKFDSTVDWLADIDSIAGEIQNVPDSSYINGCGWQLTYRLPTESLTPGYYRAEFPIQDSLADSSTGGIIFIVKPKIPGTYSNILFISATNTWEAYNNFGGKSIYDYNSSGGIRSYKDSFQRPFQDPYGSGDFYNMEVQFLLWLGQNNIYPEYVADVDLDRNPDLLSHYKLVCIFGHHEYWTNDERSQVQNYINNGGKVAIFSGNTCWWQARLENNGNTLVCYKDSTADPLYGIQDSLVTVNWYAPPVNDPENKFTGVSFRIGGFVNDNGQLTSAEGYGDYAVYNAQSWVFKGTGLKDGDEFGGDAAIVGYETDGTRFDWNNGIPIPTSNSQLKDGTPSSFKVLGISPTISNDSINFPNTHATMGYYFKPNGAYVFNAATTYWVHGLDSDSIVSRITLNVINKFLGNNFPPEIISWTPVIADSITRNYDPEVIRSRDILVNPGNSQILSLTAIDPFNANQVKYFWTLNGNLQASLDTAYIFHNNENTPLHTKNVVGAFAYINSKDTVSINWNLFDYPLVISSTPANVVKPANIYSYQVKTFNYYNDSLNYQLTKTPNWLSINQQTGLLTGTAPSIEGDTVVAIQVANKHGNLDTQSFTLHVSGSVTDVKGNSEIPATYSLSQNYPNPFNPSTIIRFEIPRAGFVTLKIYDILGRLVATLINEEKPAGTYNVKFGATSINKGLSSGIYFYRINAGNFTQTKKLVFLK